MSTVELRPRRELAEAEKDARASVLALLSACDRRELRSIVKAADTAYLAVGRLAALARAAETA